MTDRAGRELVGDLLVAAVAHGHAPDLSAALTALPASWFALTAEPGHQLELRN
jgi:hypothetical protein